MASLDNIPYVIRAPSGTTRPKTFNINGSDDPFYRYKMNQLIIQVVGKGKMIRTFLLNIDQVASDLNTIPPSYLVAYFGYEMGAQTKYDPKKSNERERAYICGEYPCNQLEEVLKKFIQDLILCPNCGIPEGGLVSDKKKGRLYLHCTGCGNTSSIDANEKFKKYVFNHPVSTETMMSKQAEKGRKDKEELAAHKSSENGSSDKGDNKAGSGEENGSLDGGKAANGTSSASSPAAGLTEAPAEDDEDQVKVLEKQIEEEERRAKELVSKEGDGEVEFSTSTTEEDIERRRKELVPQKLADLVVAGNGDNSTDSSTKKQPAKKAAAAVPPPAPAKKVEVALVDNDELTPPEQLKEFLSQQRTSEEIVAAVTQLATKYELSDRKVVQLVFEGLFELEKLVLQLGAKDPLRRNVLKKLFKTEAAKLAWLSHLERALVKADDEKTLAKTPSILKVLYDKDVIEEEVITKWFEGCKSVDVKKKAAPFIKWLKEADEESDEED